MLPNLNFRVYLISIFFHFSFISLSLSCFILITSLSSLSPSRFHSLLRIPHYPLLYRLYLLSLRFHSHPLFSLFFLSPILSPNFLAQLRELEVVSSRSVLQREFGNLPWSSTPDIIITDVSLRNKRLSFTDEREKYQLSLTDVKGGRKRNSQLRRLF